MVAVYVVGNLLERSGKQREVKPRLQLSEKTLRGPAFFQEQVFHARLCPVFAQSLLLAEDLGHGARYANRLLGKNEGIKANGEMRLPGEPSPDAQRVANLVVEFGRGEGDVVDLRMRTPRWTAGGTDFEFARQVVELRVAAKQA